MPLDFLRVSPDGQKEQANAVLEPTERIKRPFLTWPVM